MRRCVAGTAVSILCHTGCACATLTMRFRLDDGPALEVVVEVLQTEEARLGLIKELRLKEVDPDAFQTDPLCVTWPEATQVPECNRVMRSVSVPASHSVLTLISAESQNHVDRARTVPSELEEHWATESDALRSAHTDFAKVVRERRNSLLRQVTTQSTHSGYHARADAPRHSVTRLWSQRNGIAGLAVGAGLHANLTSTFSAHPTPPSDCRKPSRSGWTARWTTKSASPLQSATHFTEEINPCHCVANLPPPALQYGVHRISPSPTLLFLEPHSFTQPHLPILNGTCCVAAKRLEPVLVCVTLSARVRE